LYHPVSLQDPQSTGLQTKKGAIIAHPYGPLGGCMDDPVVLTVVEQLLDLDFVVGTFNFRYPFAILPSY
jgi:alpha/beta superfamily hydrolase